MTKRGRRREEVKREERGAWSRERERENENRESGIEKR